MEIKLIVEMKDEDGFFKAIPDYYTIDNDKIITKISFNTNVNKMLANVDNENNEIEPLVDKNGLRGIPIDSSDIYIKLVKQYGSKGKYHHFYYLRELETFKQNKYLEKKDSFGIPYSDLASDFLSFLENLSVLSEERNICFFCIRLSFFFV